MSFIIKYSSEVRSFSFTAGDVLKAATKVSAVFNDAKILKLQNDNFEIYILGDIVFPENCGKEKILTEIIKEYTSGKLFRLKGFHYIVLFDKKMS